jgi:uncharacterized delta-60 repeat protein
VSTEQRLLIAGWARASSGDNATLAIVRTCPDGSLDQGSNCSGDGFGDINSVTGKGRGIKLIDVFDGGPLERIDSIGFQTAESPGSAGCSDTAPTEKILVAGVATVPPRDQVPEKEVFVVARLCANGKLDENFGGNEQDYDLGQYDPEGIVTIVFSNGGWTRISEAFSLAVHPDNDRMVAGGFATFRPGGLGTPDIEFFALARLIIDEDDCDAQSANPGCFDLTFGPNDNDDGRIWFDGDGDQDGDWTKNEIHAIQLLEDQEEDGEYDILITGSTLVNSTSNRDFFVARVNYDGGASASLFDWTPVVVAFATNRDDIAWDLLVNETDYIVGGVSCTSAAPCASVDDVDATPDSDFALARLVPDGSGGYELDDTFGLNDDGMRLFDLDHTDVGYSLIFHPQDQGDPKLVIGGYSSEDDSQAYMSGTRFVYDADEVDGSVDVFSSYYSGTSTGNNRGDRGWELRVQNDENRIILGGFHTRGLGSGGPDFAAIRLCEEPDEEACESTEAPPSGSGREPFAHFGTSAITTSGNSALALPGVLSQVSASIKGRVFTNPPADLTGGTSSRPLYLHRLSEDLSGTLFGAFSEASTMDDLLATKLA